MTRSAGRPFSQSRGHSGRVFSGLEGEIELEPPEEGPKFGYRGQIGPAFWGDPDPAWALCSTGASQTPIDIFALNAQQETGTSFEMNGAQIEAIRNVLGLLTYASNAGTNARPTQPLNGRTVTLELD